MRYAARSCAYTYSICACAYGHTRARESVHGHTLPGRGGEEKVIGTPSPLHSKPLSTSFPLPIPRGERSEPRKTRGKHSKPRAAEGGKTVVFARFESASCRKCRFVRRRDTEFSRFCEIRGKIPCKCLPTENDMRGTQLENFDFTDTG